MGTDFALDANKPAKAKAAGDEYALSANGVVDRVVRDVHPLVQLA
jgi:hypothetical protein